MPWDTIPDLEALPDGGQLTLFPDAETPVIEEDEDDSLATTEKKELEN
jgi:hypothetical protein